MDNSLTISLMPNGRLMITFQGINGAPPRKLVLQPGHAEQTISRILAARTTARTQIGLDTSPTQAQVRHWEHAAEGHTEVSCKFCHAEAQQRIWGTRVARRFPEGQRREAPSIASVNISAEELFG